MNAVRRWAVALAIFLAAIGTRADISGSKHDFSTQTWAAGQICIVCHTPHNAGAGAGPLWNHASTATTFTLYSSPTFNGTIAQPAASTKACLSCHDGTVALDQYGGNTPQVPSLLLTGPALLGTNLSDDHPVSFAYTSALATTDGELHDPATWPSGIRTGGTIRSDMLFADQLECASCHDVHNSFSQPKLLVKSNAASALCLTCHAK